MRIDRLLFFLRFAKSRTLAQSWAEAGHIRVNGRRVEKGSLFIAVGDVITMPIGEVVITLKLLSMPFRRGPACEAQLCYQIID
ncbi:RNA-binding S4 domain-containing protein [Sphingorhabdus sp.]|uniref:RNA-binding S4 domain-containing protein n=1 Tax=Sphingorhabdus sp. TaxID=1902408 RepID=UPI00391A83B3